MEKQFGIEKQFHDINYLFIRLNKECKKPFWALSNEALILELPDMPDAPKEKLKKRLTKELKKQFKNKRRKDIYPLVFFHRDILRRLHLDGKEYPSEIVEAWQQTLPRFDTLNFLDNEFCQVKDYLYEMTNKAAVVHIFCMDENVPEYEQLSDEFFLQEGIVLQIHGYMDKQCSSILKGKIGVLDFGGNWYEASKKLPEKVIRFSLEAYVWNEYVKY